MSGDLISRDDLYHEMTMKRLELHEKGLSWNEFCRGFGFAMEFVKQAASAETERTVKVIEHDASIMDDRGYKYLRTEYLCGRCKKKVIGGDEYCSHCGCRLEWNHE